MIKRSAAIANMEVGVLDKERGGAIVSACDRILAGEFADQFVVDAINSGAGTAFNMNANEVIANVALEVMGRERGGYQYLHPNDHVNMSQSSNDTFPTAMHVSVLIGLNRVIKEVDGLIKSLSGKAEEFARYKKIGRTHLMDALPVTLGGEFEAYATAVSRARDSLAESQGPLELVALGATAVGSGANAPEGYRAAAVADLADISGLPLRPEGDMQHALQSRFAVAKASSALRNLAIELNKIANDIRLMASGPVAGLAEIGIPAVHAGSSIIPGKVNPSLAECMNMICFCIIGNDAAVAHAAQGGQFELNVMLPGMLKCMLESTDMLKNFLPVFSANLIDGLTADRGRLQKNVENSPVIVTLLAPKIGYLKSAELFKESLKTGKTIRELVLEKGMLSQEELDEIFG
jgi:aspartate ammonia-lyase